jgi:8-oxo-dGTP pyrophosphatase MutT (NUDIX family)
VKTARATSAGGVVVDGRGNVVLIARRSPKGTLQWTLPKGAVEEGETAEQAALREVREETGLEAELADKLGTIDYWFVWKPDDTRYHKFVHYFLMRAIGGDLADHDDEVEDARWYPFEDALKAASFANERALLKKAVEAARR